MARRVGTTRRTMHSTDGLDDALDAQELVRGLIKRKGIQWVHDFFVGMQQRRKGSLRKACAELGPAAVATLLTAMTQAKGWKDRIHASELLLTYGGHRPADKLEHSGKDGGPIQSTMVVYRIPDNGRDVSTGNAD